MEGFHSNCGGHVVVQLVGGRAWSVIISLADTYILSFNFHLAPPAAHLLLFPAAPLRTSGRSHGRQIHRPLVIGLWVSGDRVQLRVAEKGK